MGEENAMITPGIDNPVNLQQTITTPAIQPLQRIHPPITANANFSGLVSKSLMAERIFPTNYVPDYRGISAVPILTTSKIIPTGTVFMPDAPPMASMGLFGGYKFQKKALLPESMMAVRPMYADFKSNEINRNAPRNDVYSIRNVVAADPMLVQTSSIPMLPQVVSKTPAASVNTDIMSGITMISGKPLSGRVIMGDARAVHGTGISVNEKPSFMRSNTCDNNSRNKAVNWKGNFSNSDPQKSPFMSNKRLTSKLNLLDKITSSRVSSQIKSNKTEKKGSTLFDSNLMKSLPIEKTMEGIVEKHESPGMILNSECHSFTERPSSAIAIHCFDNDCGRKKGSFTDGDSPLNKSLSLDSLKSESRVGSLQDRIKGNKSSERSLSGCRNMQYNDNRDNPAMDCGKKRHVVHWFRKGLRLHDNPALKEAIVHCTTFRCIYILDPWFAGSSNVGVNKWRFLLQCLEDLDNSLRNLNSRLFVVRGQPANALPRLFKEWNTSVLSFEEDPEPFGKARDSSILAIAQEMEIQTIVRTSHTLYNLKAIIEKKGGKPPLTYKTFQNILTMIGPPPPVVPEVTSEDCGDGFTPLNEDHDEKYGVPNLEDLGFETDNLPAAVWKGGETEALSRLKHHLERKAWVASFGRPKMTPQSLYACPTGLSPYLRFGCLSARKFYAELNDLYMKIKKVPAPVSLHGQLLWREFFYTAATNNPKFDHMKGNPICLQIPWDKNPEALAKWAHGQTGFPWIDAIMTQLRNEGWIHNVARHAVACFLTRGDLWLSWEEGMKVFDELMLDADWSVNAGSWMWLSCSSFFQQFFHCYCPVRYGRKADPNGDFIRSYLPVLKNIPTKYIHEPWMAPESVQRNAKCIIGQHYPLPMVDHAKQSKINIERMKQVYRQLAHYRNTEPGSGLENQKQNKKVDSNQK